MGDIKSRHKNVVATFLYNYDRVFQFLESVFSLALNGNVGRFSENVLSYQKFLIDEIDNE